MPASLLLVTLPAFSLCLAKEWAVLLQDRAAKRMNIAQASI